MFDKMKMWLMTEENRQKHIMDKEKAEREAKRNPVNDKSVDKKEKPPKNKKDKSPKEKHAKKDGGLFGKKDSEPVIEDNTYEEIEPVVEEKPAPKKIVVVKKKEDLNNISDKLNIPVEEDVIDIDDNALDKLDAFINKDSNKDKLEPSVEVENTKDEEKSEFVSEKDKQFEKEIEEEMKFDNNMFADSPEEYKKMMMIKKKKEEEDRYFDTMLNLPPTADMNYMIKRAFEEGVPEWFLRKGGYIDADYDVSEIEDIAVATEKVEDDIEKVAVEKLKEQLKIDGLDSSDEDLLEVIENILEEDEDEVLEEINFENVEKEKLKSEIAKVPEIPSVNEFIEIDSEDVVDSLEAKDSEVISIIKDVIVKEEQSVIDKLFADEKLRITEDDKIKRDAEMKKKSSDLLKKLREKVTALPLKTENVSTESEVSETVSKPDVVKKTLSDEEKAKLKLKARHAIKEVVKESAETLIDKETENKAKVNVEERLRNLKKKREVLTAKDNNILVKEDIVVDGKSISSYKTYNVSDEEMSKIEVGKEIETDIHMIETEVIVDGEVYNLTEEEEAELIRKYSTREIWLLSSNEDLLEKARKVLYGTRYEVKPVITEKDFVMAIRSVDNLIVFTKDIPKMVEKSVAGFLKYLNFEKRKARLVTIDESKVNSKIIEHSFDEFSVENLDNYYKEYDYTLYRQIKKPISELYKEISFDLSSELDKDEIEIDYVENSDSEIVLTFTDEVLVNIESQKSANRFGDIELELDDIIIIDSDDLK